MMYDAFNNPEMSASAMICQDWCRPHRFPQIPDFPSAAIPEMKHP
jgi:hypothetical protein